MQPGSFHVVLSAAVETGERIEATSAAWLLYLTIIGMLIILLLAIVLLGISSRRHSLRRGKVSPSPVTDAWAVAGERAEPWDAPKPPKERPRDTPKQEDEA